MDTVTHWSHSTVERAAGEATAVQIGRGGRVVARRGVSAEVSCERGLRRLPLHHDEKGMRKAMK